MLHLHRAERSGQLAAALGEVLRAPLADPFAAEVVAVPAKGVERWLSQRLSSALGAAGPGEGDGAGVSANILFPSPDQLVVQTLQAAGGRDPDDDPWATTRQLWAVLDVIEECLGEPWCGVLAAHLGADLAGGGEDGGWQAGGGEDGASDHRRGRRWVTASMLAGLYSQYGGERPAMLADWAAGRDSDGAGRPLPGHLRWQAELWRRMRARIGGPSPAEQLPGVCRALVADPSLSPLPGRLSIFGPTRLTTEQLAVLAALAAHREVHLWLPHPSPRMWEWLAKAAPVTRRADDLSARAVDNPLLASLARDARELQQRLQPLAAAGTDTYHPGPAATPVTTDPVTTDPVTTDPVTTDPATTDLATTDPVTTDPATTTLAAVQAAIREDRRPDPRVPAAGLDDSVQVHACHGPARQVEVLREALLHAFAAGPGLEPRHVLVMCPDVETYAPLVRAAFGQGPAAGPDSHPGHRLRVRLADRSLRQTNPLLDVVATLLELAGGRVSAGEVLDLAATGPVRRRFGLDDDDLEQLRSWAATSGVRWGIGPQQRRRFGLEAIRQGTWLTGLDRVLLGVAADESDPLWLDSALPLDDVDSTEIALAGRLSELVDRLWSVLTGLQGPQPAGQWVGQLDRALDLLTAVSDRDAWQLSQARSELAEAVEAAGPGELRLADARSMLHALLAGRPTRANFRTGELTVCTMVPMRSVPHRVIALLGLDDDVFPRGAGVDGDDVLALHPGIGERDRRSEDRQLLLDAVMSAEQKLIMLYTGADPVSGGRRPPAVPLGELLDVVATTVGRPVEEIVRRHPLQPFAPRNVDAARPFSFDPAALSGARAAVSGQRPRPPFLDHPLPPRPAADVELADLVSFAQHPVRGFLRQRLGIRVPDEDDDLLDQLSADLRPLARWDVGERMLDARMRGVTPAAFADTERRRGTLPPLRLGTAVLDDLVPAVEALAAVCAPVHEGPAQAVDVDLDLGGGRRLTGTVTGVHGDVLAATSFSALAPKHRIAGWIGLLALAAARPDRPWQAVTTGRGRFSRPTGRSTLVAPPDPLAVLAEIADLRDRGLREPLPIGPATSADYADRRSRNVPVADAVAGAEKTWTQPFGDAKDRYIGYVYGRSPGLAALLTIPPSADEAGWFDEASRFGALARRLWTPLLAREQLSSP
jgi:exodeoxyribonuclease V gamma subunit